MVNEQKTIYFYKIIAFGYGMIVILISAIIYLYISEWRQFEKLEQEVKHINVLRQKVHDAYAKKLELAMYGETILEWEATDTLRYRSKDYNSTAYCVSLSKIIFHTDWIAYVDCWKIKRSNYSIFELYCKYKIR